MKSCKDIWYDGCDDGSRLNVLLYCSVIRLCSKKAANFSFA